MQEQITVLVEHIFDMPAEMSAEAQQQYIQTSLVNGACEDSCAVELSLQRFESEFDTYSHLVRDAANRAIRVGDKVFWNRHIHPVSKIHEASSRITIDTDHRRKSVVHSKHCVVVI